jgi:geranylgeranyl pyrophosphate synthase
VDGKQAFPSIAAALQSVEKELAGQARAIVANWSRNGTPEDSIQRVVGHLFAAQGKLLRPALVLLSAGLVEPRGGASERTLVRLAVAVELLHREILDLFSRTAQSMCLGEIREQQVLEDGSRVGFEEYLGILRNKTAELMSACCRAAAIACGASAPLTSALAEFGLSFGLAFQLLDDAADRDALVEEGADLRAAARALLERGRALLAGLAQGPSRTELEAACDLVLATAAP